MNDIFSKLIILILLGIIIYYLSISNNNETFKELNTTITQNLPIKKSTLITSENNNTFESNNTTSLNNPLINYSGINEFDTGADLTTAFNPPIEKTQSTDTIDFNKNNTDKYNVKDYLPKEINNEWFSTDFSNARNIDDDNLINPDRFIIGINTIGQSLKSPSWDIRGTIANPKYTVSPWGNSTYEPDYNLKSLC
jgi:hypothetical protein